MTEHNERGDPGSDKNRKGEGRALSLSGRRG